MNFLFTCGGTAGHINPALAVAGRIRELLPESGILFAGARGNMETDLVPREGFQIQTVTITNLQRSFRPDKILHNLKTVKNLVTSYGQARRIIKEFAPDVALGTGGYVCYPVLKAAADLGIPTAMLESNAVPGLTTRMLEGRLTKLLLGFEGSEGEYKHREKILVTGTPVRGAFRPRDGRRLKSELGLDPEKPLVASVWGSLGSTFMNEVMAGVIARTRDYPAWSLIHSTGKRDYYMMRGKLDTDLQALAERGIIVSEYIYNMPQVMAAADLVICRAGASTLSELAALGKPALLVPSPNVTNNHQEKNARLLERSGAARVLMESEITPEGLLGVISGLLNKKEELSAMAESMGKMAAGDATDRIAELVLQLAEGRRENGI